MKRRDATLREAVAVKTRNVSGCTSDNILGDQDEVNPLQPLQRCSLLVSSHAASDASGPGWISALATCVLAR